MAGEIMPQTVPREQMNCEKCNPWEGRECERKGGSVCEGRNSNYRRRRLRYYLVGDTRLRPGRGLQSRRILGKTERKGILGAVGVTEGRLLSRRLGRVGNDLRCLAGRVVFSHQPLEISEEGVAETRSRIEAGSDRFAFALTFPGPEQSGSSVGDGSVDVHESAIERKQLINNRVVVAEKMLEMVTFKR